MFYNFKAAAGLVLMGSMLLFSGCSISKNSPPSRSEVEEMIMAKKKDDRFYITEIGGKKEELYDFDTGTTTYNEWYRICADEREKKAYSRYLSKSSIITALIADELAETRNPETEKNEHTTCTEYKFTDKAKPYLTENNFLIVATLKGVNISQMTEPSEFAGKKTFTADYQILPELTLVGKYIYKDPAETYQQKNYQLNSVKAGINNGVHEDGKGKATLVLYDDGWKIEKASHVGF